MRFSVFQLSRQGGRRKNEDSMGYCYTSQAALFVVADGMGGHPEGEVASNLALKTVASSFNARAVPRLLDPPDFLRAALGEAHRLLLEYAQGRSLEDTPRTTIVACVLQDDEAWWAHCGDSRLYVIRESQVLARTRDHSYREMSVALGRTPPGGTPVGRNVLFTCLGSPVAPMIDTAGPWPLAQGDRILLCSDGLWGALDDADIVRLMEDGPVDSAVPRLVERALRANGSRSDNVTALGLQWEGSDPASLAAGALTLPLPGMGPEAQDELLAEGPAPAAPPAADATAPSPADNPAPPPPLSRTGGTMRRLNERLRRVVRRRP